jgi:hypothetical protein
MLEDNVCFEARSDVKNLCTDQVRFQQLLLKLLLHNTDQTHCPPNHSRQHLEKHLVGTMALPQENIRALDQLRQRLQQLSTSLNILKTDLSRQETLPTW